MTLQGKPALEIVTLKTLQKTMRMFHAYYQPYTTSSVPTVAHRDPVKQPVPFSWLSSAILLLSLQCSTSQKTGQWGM